MRSSPTHLPTSPEPTRVPEAMADVPGVCELPLTRAVVQYRDVHEVDVAGGRIQDIGLALVLEGRYASSAEVVDLGSGDVKVLDLSAELVVLDWVYEPTLEHVAGLLRERSEGGEGRALRRFCFGLALRILERTGFGPLTRPTLLRIGFRDVCRDLDLHEGTSVRVETGSGRVVRAHLDYDSCALLLRLPVPGTDSELEGVLVDAFPGGDLRRLVSGGERTTGGYQVRFPLPHDLAECRSVLEAVRTGLVHLLERYEPRRSGTVERMLETFGHRETLARMRVVGGGVRAVPVGPSPASRAAAGTSVH